MTVVQLSGFDGCLILLGWKYFLLEASFEGVGAGVGATVGELLAQGEDE